MKKAMIKIDRDLYGFFLSIHFHMSNCRLHQENLKYIHLEPEKATKIEAWVQRDANVRNFEVKYLLDKNYVWVRESFW